MDAAVGLRRATVDLEQLAGEFPRLAMALRVDAAGPTVADRTAWPVLWARCWVRVRSWGLPPRWSAGDWWDEAYAQGALAASQARREFDPRQGAPLDAFLYRRVVEAVWTRHRQERSYGDSSAPSDALPDHPAPARLGPDQDTLIDLQVALEGLAELDRDLIRQLFWKGRSEDDVAREWGISQQAVSKRKKKILRTLRHQVGTP